MLYLAQSTIDFALSFDWWITIAANATGMSILLLKELRFDHSFRHNCRNRR